MVANSRAAFKKQTPSIATFSPFLRVPQELGVYKTALNQQTSQPPQPCLQPPEGGCPGHSQHPESSKCLTLPWTTLMSPSGWEQRIQVMEVLRPPQGQGVHIDTLPRQGRWKGRIPC